MRELVRTQGTQSASPRLSSSLERLQSPNPLPQLTTSYIAKQKADVAEHPEVFDHVGLLVNEPPGMAGLLSI